MRVALMSSYIPPHPGGQERHVSDLARWLAERGHDVTVITSDLSGAPGIETPGYDIIWLPSVRLGSDALPRGLRRTLRRLDPDLVHIHSPLSFISTMTSACCRDIPVVATYHGDFYKSSLPGNILKNLRNHLQLPYTLCGARRIMVLTESDKLLLASYGVDSGTVEVVPPGLDLDDYTPAVGNGGPSDHRVLYVGRVVHEKGIRELVAAFAELCDRTENVELLIAGTGYALDETRRSIEEMGLGARVRFLGWVDHDDLRRLYRESCLVVLPSFSEGLPYAMLEAMAAGRPVVCSDVSGMRELVHHGENGLLFDIHDPDALREAMERLLSDPPGCERMGARAREYCMSRFSKERWLDDIERVYGEAV